MSVSPSSRRLPLYYAGSSKRNIRTLCPHPSPYLLRIHRIIIIIACACACLCLRTWQDRVRRFFDESKHPTLSPTRGRLLLWLVMRVINALSLRDATTPGDQCESRPETTSNGVRAALTHCRLLSLGILCFVNTK